MAVYMYFVCYMNIHVAFMFKMIKSVTLLEANTRHIPNMMTLNTLKKIQCEVLILICKLNWSNNAKISTYTTKE